MAMADYSKRFNEGDIDLPQVEQLSAAFTRVTSRGLQQGLQVMITPLITSNRWLEETPKDLQPEHSSVIFMEWGRDILPSIWEDWASGSAEAAADYAFYDLIRYSDIMEAEQAVNAARHRLHRLRAEKQEDAPGNPPRTTIPKRKQERATHYCDSEGWHAEWTQRP